MSDGNRVLLSYKNETTWGTTPAGNWKDLRITSESLQSGVDTIFSQELRSDRQIQDLLRNGLRATGDINFELSYGAYDDIFPVAFQSAGWSAVQTNAGTFSSSAGGSTITGTGVATGISPGQWIRFKDGTTLVGYYKVITSVAGTLTVTPTTVLITGGGNEEVEAGEQIVNGTTFDSFSLQRDYQDLATNEYTNYVGMSPSELEFQTQSDQIVTGRVAFLGKTEAVADTDAETHDAAPSNDVLTGIDGVYQILEGTAGTLVAVNATNWSFTLRNNLRERLQIGTLGPISIGSGTVEVEGTWRAYLTDAETIHAQFTSFASRELAIVYQDALGNAYIVDFPKVKYRQSQRNATGINTDVFRDMTFGAIRHGTENITIRMVRFAA